MSVKSDGMWPRIRTVGIDGYLVSFADRLDEAANRAALAFRAAIERQGWQDVEESSTSLASAYVRFDPLRRTHEAMRADLQTLLQSRNWYEAALPSGRRLWRIPTVFGGSHGPQLDEAAALVGLSPKDAIDELSQMPVRVQTIGFAPGMPYLGELPARWNIPRQTALNAQVPRGGLCVAIRQLVLFPVATPTGWRHIGQTAVRLFRPEAEVPFLLRPGDEVLFTPMSAQELEDLEHDARGGSVCENLE